MNAPLKDWQLGIIPAHWSLTPVLDKRPLRSGWQDEPSIERDRLLHALDHGEWLESRKGKRWFAQWNGFGLRTGSVSGGLMAIDVDGPTAAQLYTLMSGQDQGDTVSWNSGKPGRRQELYQLSEKLQQRLESVGFTHYALKEWQGFVCDAEKDEQLDFRFNRSQSVLPPSVHPETGAYRWIHSVADTAVAPATQWIEQFLFDYCDRLEAEKIERERVAAQRAEYRRLNPLEPSEDFNAQAFLDAIDPNLLGWYEWRDCLLAAHDSELDEHTVRAWSSYSAKHSEHGFNDVWRAIKGKGGLTAGTLYHYAKEQGYQPPKRQHSSQSLGQGSKASAQVEARQDGEISRDRFEFLQWVKRTYNRAAYRFARDHGHLPENPQLRHGQTFALTPPGFWDENQAFLTRGLIRTVCNCTPATVPTVPHWEAMGKPRLFFTANPAGCLSRMAELGYHSVLADDVTGAGKSQVAGQLMQSWAAKQPDPETDKAVYFATDYKNPSTLALESIPETPTGGAIDYDKAHKTEGGKWHRKRSSKAIPDISAMCIEDENIQALRANGIDVYRGKDSEICGGCKNFQNGGCMFLRAQAQAQQSPVLRSHLSKGGNGAIAIVDEAGVSIGSLRQVEAKPSDITLERGLIAYRDKVTAEAAADVLNMLQQSLERAIEERGIHGLTHAELLPMLPSAEALETKLFDVCFDDWLQCDDPWGYPLLNQLAAQITKAAQPNLGELFDGRDGAESKAEAIRDQVSPGILPRLLRIISGGSGDVAISGHGGLTFTYRNRRNQRTLENFKTRIFLDSTPDVIDLARKVGCKAEDFCKVRWTAPRFDNLTIKVVKGIGTAGQQRRDESEYTEQQRINALVLEICDRAGSASIGLLDLKRYSSIYESLGLDALGHQFAHSRGSNEFKSCDQMIVIAGNAKANLGALLSEWHCLTGEAATVKTASPAFWAWSDRKATANLLQANGRTRAQHRPMQAITHWLVGDISQKDRDGLEQLYPGCMVEEVQAYDITPAAASQGYRSDRAIVEAMWSLTEAGEAATIDRVSDAAGLAKSTVSERVKAFDIGGFKTLRKSSDLLYKALNNNPELFETAPELTPELIALAKEYLPMLADELEQGRDAAEVVADYVNIFESVGAAAFRRLLDCVPAETMARLYESRGFRDALERYDSGPGLLGAIALVEVA